MARLTFAAFVDSQGWMAIINRRDQCHEAASESYQQLGMKRWKLYTSNWTVYDALSHLRERAKNGGYDAARSLEQAVRLPDVVVVPVTKAIEERAIVRFWRMVDKDWSVTLCANMEIIRDASIQYVLSARSAYGEAGFVPLIRPIDGQYHSLVSELYPAT